LKKHEGRAFARPTRFQRCYQQPKTRIKSVIERNTGSGIHALPNLVKVTLKFSVSRP